jgi:hypothetical protein
MSVVVKDGKIRKAGLTVNDVVKVITLTHPYLMNPGSFVGKVKLFPIEFKGSVSASKNSTSSSQANVTFQSVDVIDDAIRGADGNEDAIAVRAVSETAKLLKVPVVLSSRLLKQ